MRINFEPMTKRSTVSTEWKTRQDHMKKHHKTQRGTSQKRNWNEA